jgi:hypothetical protein
MSYFCRVPLGRDVGYHEPRFSLTDGGASCYNESHLDETGLGFWATLLLLFSTTNDLHLPFEEVFERKSKSNSVNLFGFPVRFAVQECDYLAMRTNDVLCISDAKDMCVACHANGGREKVYVNGLPSLKEN